MPLFQIGYRRYEGKRTPHLLRWWPITRTGVSIAWRSKLLRRLVFVSFLPFLYFGWVFFVIGRITAANALSKKGSRENVAALIEAYASESFWGARIHIAKALASVGSQQAVGGLSSCVRNELDPMVLESLITTLDRPDPMDYQFRTVRLDGVSSVTALLERTTKAWDRLTVGYTDEEMPLPEVEHDVQTGHLMLTGRTDSVRLYEQASASANT